jgi:hypothetical protein
METRGAKDECLGDLGMQLLLIPLITGGNGAIGLEIWKQLKALRKLCARWREWVLRGGRNRRDGFDGV